MSEHSSQTLKKTLLMGDDTIVFRTVCQQLPKDVKTREMMKKTNILNRLIEKSTN